MKDIQTAKRGIGSEIKSGLHVVFYILFEGRGSIFSATVALPPVIPYGQAPEQTNFQRLQVSG